MSKYEKYKDKVLKKLNDRFIPDLSKLIINYLCCKKCNIIHQGPIKCICYNYMCECNGKVLCRKCDKVICHSCHAKYYCCEEPNKACSFCGKVYIENFCIYEECDTKMCKICFEKFDGLCRGHLLYKKYYREKYQGL